MSAPSRIAFSTLAFPDATLASAAALGRRWGYAGIELRLIDGELIDPSMPATDRVRVKRTLTGLPVVAVDSSIRLTGDDPGPELHRFLQLASDWESPMVRVFGGTLATDGPARRKQLGNAGRVLEAAGPLAERLGVAIGVETHDAFSASAVVAELLTRAGSARCGTAIIRTGWVSGRKRSTRTSARV
jgi:sugar phosphate isomerase/epimerase